MKTPIANKPSLTLFVLVFIAMMVSSGLSLANESQNEAQWIAADREVKKFLEKGDCLPAKAMMDKVSSAYDLPLEKKASYIPIWLIGLYKCVAVHGDGTPYLDDLDQFYRSLIKVLLDRNDCKAAETILPESANRKNGVINPDLIYEVARCFESQDKKKSLAMYHAIIKRTSKDGVAPAPNDETAVMSQFRVNWLIGDRSWVYSDPLILINGVTNALQNKDLTALGKFASRSNFHIGAYDGYSIPFLFEFYLKDHSFLDRFKKSPIVIKEPNNRNGRYELRTEGWQGEYPVQYLILERGEFGWQWTIWAECQAIGPLKEQLGC